MFVTRIVATTADCHVDPGPLTSGQAHRAMQLHLHCRVDSCRARRRARDTLVATHRMVLDERGRRC